MLIGAVGQNYNNRNVFASFSSKKRPVRSGMPENNQSQFTNEELQHRKNAKKFIGRAILAGWAVTALWIGTKFFYWLKNSTLFKVK